jgi:mono/diheme cytochrome c family protein
MLETNRFRSWVWFLAVVIAAALIAACGGGSSDDSASDSAASGGQPVVPTMPPAQFTAVAQQSVTNTVAITATRVVTQSVQADAQVLQRGGVIYINRKCGDCHGSQGEGVADKGPTLAGSTLTLQEFENVLRTGGMGELGPDHIYGSSAISPTGMQALYAWVQSLSSQ